jgi:hypothetical protein
MIHQDLFNCSVTVNVNNASFVNITFLKIDNLLREHV